MKGEELVENLGIFFLTHFLLIKPSLPANGKKEDTTNIQ